MKVVLTEKERRILLGLLQVTEDQLKSGKANEPELPEALGNIASLRRKLS